MPLSYRAAAAGLALAAASLIFRPCDAPAHGFAGERFFPATILTDDPFVADELSLPTVTRNPTGPDGAQEIDIGIDLAKRLTPDLGFTIGREWKYLQPKDAPAVTGFGALEAGLQYQFFKNAEHEATALFGLKATFGHTGRVAALGEPDFTTLSPTLNFGKGFGNLPESMPWLRPIAVTGNLGFDFPLKTESAGTPNPNNVNYGFAFEYSLEYLQHHVKDIGLTPPFDRLIPLVEISFSTALNRGAGGQTIGTVQPGVIWAGQYVQIGAEAIIPATRLTGRGYGGVVQLHFYLDDIFPDTIGRPLVGR
jgi:hypothetical protein